MAMATPRRRLATVAIAFAVASTVLWRPAGAPGFDIIYLKSGEPLKCRIDAAVEGYVKARVLVESPSGATTVARTIRLSEVARIDFETPEAESAALENAGPEELEAIRELWNQKRKLLGVPQSNAGEAGLILAGLLLDGSKGTDASPARRQIALETFEAVEQGDWDPGRRMRGKHGRLRALLALGRPDEALVEARQIQKEAEDPAILIETRHVMARAALQELKALVDENPKWRDDDDVRATVDAAFQSAVDQFLHPFLFHGASAEPAARGLWGAVETYLVAGERENARKRIDDILALYPDAAVAPKARERREQLRPKNESRKAAPSARQAADG